MERVLLALTLGVVLGIAEARAIDGALDVEAECRSISASGVPGCRCLGLYFENKFGPDEGAAALHLVGRSYASDPNNAVIGLYDRFGAATLDNVAQRILGTHDEAMSYCPSSAHVAD
jgi:hypothetical protein